MSLTVPRAGVIAGASAAPQVEAGRSGELIAGLGGRMMEIGLRIKADHDQRSLGRAQVDMMQGLTGLQQEYQQVGDPDRIDTEVPQRMATLKGQIVEQLPVSVRERAGLMFDEMAVPQSARLGGRAIELRQSQELGTLAQAGDAMAQAWATADPDTRASYLAQYEQSLQQAVARGVIMPAQAEQMRGQVIGQAETARATRMLSDNPDQLVGAIDAGEFGAMDGAQAQSWRSRGTAAVQAAEAKAALEAERARRDRDAAATAVFQDGVGVYGKGVPFARAGEADQLLADPEIAALPAAREYQASQKLWQLMPQLGTLTIGQKREALAEAEKRPAEKGYDADILGALRGQIAADEKGLQDDPLGHVSERLGGLPALPDPSTASAEDVQAAFAARGRYSEALREKGYYGADQAAPPIFTKAEREGWGKMLGPEASPAVRARAAEDMAKGLGPAADSAARELGADPVFTYVGGGLAAGLDQRLGREIFEGERIIAQKQVKMPAVASRNEQFFTAFSGLFPDGVGEQFGDQSEQRNQIIAAADALYAYRRRGQLSDGSADDAQIDLVAYRQAVHEVMGGTGTYASRGAAGGIGEVNGAMTMLPQGVKAGALEQGLSALAAVQDGSGTNDMAWTLLSNGIAPKLEDGRALDARTIGRAILHPVGDDRYIMLIPNRQTGESRVIMGTDDKPLQIGGRALARMGGGS